ncbi:LytR/AlgR family response regulator transcription factor [Chitinophaga flava]|uniref:DNA-binding response regulator n=1 Tax=Chitinophaga flava TaxID=2259036 RepID=A0A365XWD3_9BACT|nr:LytTR family DNA-binding domain-containing protein [Chitinophaga flava]RBL89895.1 DNA-binding response regulator [Chitinophaga flava]
MTITTVIIEDDEKNMHVICDLIRQFAPDLEVVGTASHISESIELIENRAPQLVFMDIQIADGTGFDVLRKLSAKNFELVFITAYDNYALKAFKFAAIDYLLKPVGLNEFREAVDRARTRINEKTRHQHVDTLLHNLAQQSSQDRKISVATVNGFEFLDLKDIIWCHSEGSYTTFHLANNMKVTSSRGLGFYENLLGANNFCRIHQSTIINLRFIKSYIKGKNGYVTMTNGVKLEISQRRKNDFLNTL